MLRRRGARASRDQADHARRAGSQTISHHSRSSKGQSKSRVVSTTGIQILPVMLPYLIRLLLSLSPCSTKKPDQTLPC